MPPEILVPLVVIGIPAVVILAKVLGMGKAALLQDKDVVRARLRRERNDFTCDDLIVANNKKVALAKDNKTGQFGLVFTFGDRTVARLFDPQSAPEIETDKTGINMKFSDYTLPDLHLDLDATEVSNWQRRLSA